MITHFVRSVRKSAIYNKYLYNIYVIYTSGRASGGAQGGASAGPGCSLTLTVRSFHSLTTP